LSFDNRPQADPRPGTGVHVRGLVDLPKPAEVIYTAEQVTQTYSDAQILDLVKNGGVKMLASEEKFRAELRGDRIAAVGVRNQPISPDAVAEYMGRKPITFVFSNQAPDTGCTVRLGNQEFCSGVRIMVDTGSDVVVVSKSLLQTANVGWVPSTLRVYTSTGECVPCEGKVEVPVQFIFAKGTEYEVCFGAGSQYEVMIAEPNSAFDVLMGQELMHKTAGFIDPFLCAYRYRPFLLRNGHTTLHDLPGAMYKGPDANRPAYPQGFAAKVRRVLQVVVDESKEDIERGLDRELQVAEELVETAFMGRTVHLEAFRPVDWPRGGVADTQDFRESMWAVGVALTKGATGAEHAQFLSELSNVIQSEILDETAAHSHLALNRAASGFKEAWQQVSEAAAQVAQLKMLSTRSALLGIQLSWLALLQLKFLGCDARTRKRRRRAWFKKQARLRRSKTGRPTAKEAGEGDREAVPERFPCHNLYQHLHRLPAMKVGGRRVSRNKLCVFRRWVNLAWAQYRRERVAHRCRQQRKQRKRGWTLWVKRCRKATGHSYPDVFAMGELFDQLAARREDRDVDVQGKYDSSAGQSELRAALVAEANQGVHPFSCVRAACYSDATRPEGPPDLSVGPDDSSGQGKFVFGNHPAFSDVQQRAVEDLVEANRDVFAFSMRDLTGYKGPLPPFSIPLDHAQDIMVKPRKQAPKEREIQDIKCRELQDLGMIVPCSDHKYVQNVVIAAKKDEEGNWTDSRMCVDYRPINVATTQDKYPLHLAEDLWGRVGNAKVFSKIDMRSGFHQVPVNPADQRKTAFWWGNRAWMYVRCPFGLKNIPAYFQRIMDDVITRAGLSDCCGCFIDDLLVYSDTPEEHLQHLGKVFAALRSAGLKAHPGKSIFGSSVVEYLGHNVSVDGLSPLAAKVQAIRALARPTNVSDLRAVLGLINYYRCYIPYISKKAAPLTQLLRKGVDFKWGPEQQVALDELKEELCTDGKVLRRYDPSKPLVLHTDWSLKGIGGVLGQSDGEGREWIVACVSRSLNKHEKNYSSYQGEMLAAVWCIKTLRAFLLGRHFVLLTDHQPLTWLMKSTELSGQHARWALSLQDYDFAVVHRPGAKHQNADVMSRLPQVSTVDITGARMDVDSRGLTERAQWVPGQCHIAACCAEHAHCDTVRHAVAAYGCADRGYGSWDDGNFVGDVLPDRDTWFNNQKDTSDALASRAAAILEEQQHEIGTVALQTPLALDVRRGAKGAVVCNSLCTSAFGHRFFHKGMHEGVVLFEVFGGMCAGLEALLRAGIRIKRYYHSDISPVVRKVAMARIERLRALYPRQFLPGACSKVFALPSDVRAVTSDHLIKEGALGTEQWMVIAGWECQDLSTAGSNRGLRGQHSSTFYPLVNLLATLQLLQIHNPPAYLLENVAMQHNFHSQQIAVEDFNAITSVLGMPVCLDAARVDSYAHRLRNYWTNIADAFQLGLFLHKVERTPGKFVDNILGEGRIAQPAAADDHAPFYCCNKKGQRLQALPTLCAFPRSRAYRDLEQGVLYDQGQGIYDQPSVAERELILGYEQGATFAPGVTEVDRHQILGRAMDAHAMEWLIVGARVLQNFFPDISTAFPRVSVTPPAFALVPATLAAQGVGVGVPRSSAAPNDDRLEVSSQSALDQVLVAQETEDAVALQQEHGDADVYDDIPVLQYVQKGVLPSAATPVQLKRIVARARAYRWTEGVLHRVMVGGVLKIVPPKGERDVLITSTHQMCGHFGVRRTTCLLRATYWWKGLKKQVRDVVGRCEACSQIRASFDVKDPVLKPLPIMGMFYRWGVDLAGPFRKTPQGEKEWYIMVCIEHFTKWIELIAIRTKTAAATAQAFLSSVIARYGASAEVVTDGGTEFQGEFEDLLTRSLIDHRVSSPGHPQSDGLAERAVQTVKRALKKYAETKGGESSWEVNMHWVALGYRCSVQESTGHSPYHLMYGVEPTIPPAMKQRFETPLNFDELGEETINALLQRSRCMQHMCMAAGHNLAIAQHRDTLRYAQIRSGDYAPRLKKFEVGDYVYLKRPKRTSVLQAAARPLILRVKAVLPTGRLVLQGRCGRTTKVHMENCAPCHLQGLTGELDPDAEELDDPRPCEVCGDPDDGEQMLLCDGCDRGWHMYCLEPKLDEVPEGDWFCPRCQTGNSAQPGQGEPEESVEALVAPKRIRKLSGAESGQPAGGNARRLEHDKAKGLAGRVLARHFLDTATGKPQVKWGTLRVLGEEQFPNVIEIIFQDGSRETTNLKGLGRDIMPVGTEMPSSTIPVSNAAGVPVRLPEGEVNFSKKEYMEKVVRVYMPGKWQSVNMTRMCAAVPGTAAFLEYARGCRMVPATHIAALAKVIRFKLLAHVTCLWGELDGMPAWLQKAGLSVTKGELGEGYKNLLQPGYLEHMLKQGLLRKVVVQPWHRLLDLTLPMIAHGVEEVLLALVPAMYVTNAPAVRAAWFKMMQKQGRLLIIAGLDNAGSSAGFLWVCIFSNQGMRDFYAPDVHGHQLGLWFAT